MDEFVQDLKKFIISKFNIEEATEVAGDSAEVQNLLRYPRDT